MDGSLSCLVQPPGRFWILDFRLKKARSLNATQAAIELPPIQNLKSKIAIFTLRGIKK
jgi:hypothetical protein